jgi:preprotein translocase subunit SecA
MILKTQERIENHFFEARKHVLEYDDVLNAQREHIYGLRREILLGKNVSEDMHQYVREVVPAIVEASWVQTPEGDEAFDYEKLYEEANDIFPLVDFASPSELRNFQPGPELSKFLQDKAEAAYAAKTAENGEETMREIERWALLRSVNDRWMEHLQTVDYIREGIGLRGYGQVDPLVAYKRETYETFQTTLKAIRETAAKLVFRIQVSQPPPLAPQVEAPAPAMLNLDQVSDDVKAQYGVATAVAPVAAGTLPAGIDWKQVGRNDPCPCGSGKKFKACHYAQLRAEGVI